MVPSNGAGGEDKSGPADLDPTAENCSVVGDRWAGVSVENLLKMKD